MPAFDQAQVDKYFSEVLNAIVKGDKDALKRFGQRFGFKNNKIRALVWCLSSKFSQLIARPHLLDCSNDGCALYEDEQLEFPDVDIQDRVTIQQDVRRSFTRFPGSSIRIGLLTADLEEKRRVELEDKLQRILETVLRIYPRLHYVQVFSIKFYCIDEGISRRRRSAVFGCRR